MKTRESRTPQSGIASVAAEFTPSTATVPDDASQINFNQVRENKRGLWKSAAQGSFEVSQVGRPDLFLVDDTDSDDPLANTSLMEGDAHYVGWCSCSQFTDHGVCEHLCRLRQAQAVEGLDVPSV